MVRPHQIDTLQTLEIAGYDILEATTLESHGSFDGTFFENGVLDNSILGVDIVSFNMAIDPAKGGATLVVLITGSEVG
jgi:hypothetical protein